MEWMLDVVEGWLPLILLGLLLSATVTYWRVASSGLPPGPWGLPGLGYLLFIDNKAPYETFSDLARRYGPVYSLRLGGLLTVFVSDPQLIRQAFGQDVFSGRAPLYLTHGIMQGHGNFMFNHVQLCHGLNGFSVWLERKDWSWRFNCLWNVSSTKDLVWALLLMKKGEDIKSKFSCFRPTQWKQRVNIVKLFDKWMNWIERIGQWDVLDRQKWKSHALNKVALIKSACYRHWTWICTAHVQTVR